MHLIKATIYDKSGTALSMAYNSYTKSHPLQAKWAERVGRPACIFLHAEIAALAKLRRWQYPHSIMVERYTKNGKPALAAPCSVCQAALKSFGIKQISYTL